MGEKSETPCYRSLALPEALFFQTSKEKKKLTSLLTRCLLSSFRAADGLAQARRKMDPQGETDCISALEAQAAPQWTETQTEASPGSGG